MLLRSLSLQNYEQIYQYVFGSSIIGVSNKTTFRQFPVRFQEMFYDVKKLTITYYLTSVHNKILH